MMRSCEYYSCTDLLTKKHMTVNLHVLFMGTYMYM